MRNALTGAVMATAILLAFVAAPPAGASDAAPAAPAAAPTATAKAPLALETFLRHPTFKDMKISPDGKHLAATVPMDDDKTILAVFSRETMKPTAFLQIREGEHVDRFVWVSDERLVVSAAIKLGMLDAPMPTGELFGVDADGKRTSTLFGFRVNNETTGSNIRRKQQEAASAFLLDTLPGDERHVLIVVQPWDNDGSLPREVRRMNVNSGVTQVVTRAPMPNAWFLTDGEGNVRVGYGQQNDGNNQVYVRGADGGEWRLFHDQKEAGYEMYPLAFERGNRTMLASRSRDGAADAVVSVDLATGAQTDVLDLQADPTRLLVGRDRRYAYALRSDPGLPRLDFLSTGTPEERLARALVSAFPGQLAMLTSFTSDGKHALVSVGSDRNSGEFYLLETETMKAHFLAASRDWLDPAAMAQVRPVTIPARDGQVLHGYLTVPNGREAKDLPLVVNPHGGPHGIRDYWEFDEEAQLLASRGYAVLKVNFRGSGGYGSDFERAGHRQWGGRMQDDIADAVRWAVKEGHADGDRVCIYGGSYGGYAALMNAARYPELYRCAVGYAGVYDLSLMYNDGDIRQTLYGKQYLARVLGNEGLAQNSPVNLADRIKVPVLLIHGGEDVRVPQAHADRMRRALKDAGNDPEWLVEPREGHGFYNMESRVRMYTQLLAFLDRHIGNGAQRARVAAP